MEFEPDMPPLWHRDQVSDWAAIVFLLGPDGKTILVLDARQDFPMWKFPGGKKKWIDNNSPRATAARELFEETGIMVQLSDLQLIKRVDKSDHYRPHSLFVFLACVDNFDGLLKRGDEDEYVKIFDLKKIPKMKCLLKSHWGYVKKIYAEAMA